MMAMCDESGEEEETRMVVRKGGGMCTMSYRVSAERGKFQVGLVV